MPRFNRLSLSLASTAAVALASLPLALTPAKAAKGSEGTTSSIGVIETSSDAQQFNLKTQGAFLQLVARRGDRPPKPQITRSNLKQLSIFIFKAGLALVVLIFYSLVTPTPVTPVAA